MTSSTETPFIKSTASPANNANIDELNKFSDLASRWWDTTSEFKPLHDINPLRVGWINERAVLNNKRVLDIGCGGGILSESMARMGAEVTGIDLSEPSISVARLHALESELSVDYECVAAEDFAAENPAQFDVVTCLELLEHVPDPASTVAACAEAVKPGGYVFFSTLNRNPKSWLFAIVGAEYLLQLLPKGTHDHAKFIKPSELGNFCRQAALDVKDITGMTYNPITQQYKLESDIDVNYMIACQKLPVT
jgi:2-polyprenyl-6-hydroxyphenyl methylase / 3-demethylubiquinone-9 3-methyltransferase